MPAEGRHAYTMFKRKYMVALAGLLAPLALILSAFPAYFHIMLPASSISLSEPGARAYYINEECILLVWHDNVFMIYPIRRSVVQPSDFRNSLLGMIVWPRDSPLVLWHRGAYAGVLLGDPVKGDELEKFDFVDDQVRIQARFHDPSTQPSEIVVKLPNAN